MDGRVEDVLHDLTLTVVDSVMTGRVEDALHDPPPLTVEDSLMAGRVEDVLHDLPPYRGGLCDGWLC